MECINGGCERIFLTGYDQTSSTENSDIGIVCGYRTGRASESILVNFSLLGLG